MIQLFNLDFNKLKYIISYIVDTPIIYNIAIQYLVYIKYL